jgi:hypothetical protein
MSTHRTALALCAAALVLTGCARTSLETKSSAPERAPSGAEVRLVPSINGKYEGEISGTPAPDSRFAKVKIGMELQQVLRLIGNHDQLYSHESGKRWIPFYFGNDVRRVVVLYRGEGCLTYTGGNVWGGGGNELIRIDVDPDGKCYQP